MRTSRRNSWLFVAAMVVMVALAVVLLALGLSGPRDSATARSTPRPAGSVPAPLASGGGGHAARPASTATPAVTRAYPGTYTGTPTPNAIAPDRPDPTTSQSYVVQTGDTLSGIAYFFGCTVEEIAAANGVAPDAIWPGQQLVIPVGASVSGPDLKLIPDSELVYGPATIHFDLTGFVTGQLGYLASYTEQVEGRTCTGAEIVRLVAQRYSVGPRVLLALLELQAGWVTDPDPAEETLYFPMGTYEEYREGLFQQLSWTADQLNSGYYGWKNRDWTTLRLLDGTRAAIAPGLNPGTVGVQNYLAQVSSGETWETGVGSEGFAATYERLFGNPFAYTVEPLVPPDLAQPALYLPWEEGQIWYLTGGPHGGWGSGSGWAALDFAPHGEVGCQVASEWATAAASGLVLRSEEGEVVIDLDGDGYEQSGWVLTYLHIDSLDRVEAGTWVERGQRIGHPSCEGGVSIATHLHLARRYNGVWIAAGDGPVPLVLSGWTAEKGAREYDGTMVKGNQVREACECTLDDFNGLLSDNAP